MSNYKGLKHLFLLLGLLLPIAWCTAASITSIDGYSAIQVKVAHVQGVPKGNTIQASIDGHTLTVVFSENLGQVDVEVTTALGGTVEYLSITTPNGLQFYIPNAGNYIVTFTLPNGDEYYGEFEVLN